MTQTIKVWIYPGANPNSSPTSWGPYEADVSAYVRRPGQDGGAPIEYQWGKQDESTFTDSGQMTLTLDNRDGRFSTDKIDGPYASLLDINTPIRLGVVSGTDSFTRTVTAALGPAAGWGGNWTNSSAGAGAHTYSVNGSRGLINTTAAGAMSTAPLSGASGRDVDMTSIIRPIVTASGASYTMGHMVRLTDVDNFVFSTLEFNVAGDATIKIRRRLAGVEVTLASLNPIPSSSYTAGVNWTLRTQMDGDTIRVKAWPTAGTEPTAWMLSADEGDNAGTGVGSYAGRFSGNTNSGNFVGLDDITVTGLEWTGYVSSWPLRWDTTTNNSWAPITAGGILRRLRQGTNPIQSPLRHLLSSEADVSGYWPLEEGVNAKYFLPASPSTAPATMADLSPGSDTSLAGASMAPVMNSATSRIVAQTKTANGGTGMSAMVIFKIPSIPGSKTRIIRVRTSRGPAPIYDFSIESSGSTTVEALAADGTVLSTATNVAAFDFTNTWVAWQLETDNSGGSTAWSSIYREVTTNASFWSQTGTVAGGTNSIVTSIELGGISGTAYSHIWLGENTLPFVDNNFANVVGGWDKEPSGRRFIRVCGEAGISCSVAGPNSILDSTELMGPQKEGGSNAILQACIDADYGVLTERGAGLEMVPRLARWNLTQTMALLLSSGHIAQIPLPTRDDQKLRNKWTVSRTGGSSDTAVNQTSIDRNGTADDSATLNVFDDSVLYNHAAWRVNIGTQPRLRWPSVSINLARNPSLADYWRRRFYGWRFGVTTGLTQVKGNEPDLIMEGFQARLDPDNWEIEMMATDARVWTAAVTDDTGIYGRADNEYCTTTATISSTATSIPITTGTLLGLNMPKWDNTAGLWTGGVDFNVGGERVTVTSISNGAGQAQTLNVSARGAGGYATSHASGTSVFLWSSALVAL